MKPKKSYTLCEGTGCPIKGKCARYQANLDRRTTDWFGIIPYQHERTIPFKNGTKCGHFDGDVSERLN